MNTAAGPDTILLVHGFWVTPRSWEKWIAHYEAKGYNVIAPAYPGFEVEVESLNEDDTPIVEARVPAIVENFENAIKDLDRPADHHRPLGRRARSPRCCWTTASVRPAWR